MSWKRRDFVLVVIGILLVGGVILTTTVKAGAISRQLHSWKVLPEPERLTELYFTDHAKLPRSYVVDSTQTIAFTVHNLEYRSTNYHYVITESSQPTAVGVNPVLLASGDFSLAQNGYQRPSVPVVLADLGAHAQISVTLNILGSSPETISYLVGQTGPVGV